MRDIASIAAVLAMPLAASALHAQHKSPVIAAATAPLGVGDEQLDAGSPAANSLVDGYEAGKRVIGSTPKPHARMRVPSSEQGDVSHERMKIVNDRDAASSAASGMVTKFGVGSPPKGVAMRSPMGAGDEQRDAGSPIVNSVEKAYARAKNAMGGATGSSGSQKNYVVNLGAANAAMTAVPVDIRPDVIRACQYQADDEVFLSKPVLCQRLTLNGATGQYFPSNVAFWAAMPKQLSANSSVAMRQGLVLFETPLRSQHVGQRSMVDPVSSFGEASAALAAQNRKNAASSAAGNDTRSASGEGHLAGDGLS